MQWTLITDVPCVCDSFSYAVVVNLDQYRGRLDPAALLRALCSGFREGSEPAICLTGGLEVNDCATHADHCWADPSTGASACVDTFRGFLCRCPKGYEGDGHTCTDIDECALGISGCDQICVNEPGSYHCDCEFGYTLHGGQGGPGMCLPNIFKGATRLPTWILVLTVLAAAATLSAAGLALYRWRLRREMAGEIRAIMREYMPLDGQEDAESRRGLLSGGSGGSGGVKIPARHPSRNGGGGGLGGGNTGRGEERDLEMSTPGPAFR
jgi:hypothetical protein